MKSLAYMNIIIVIILSCTVYQYECKKDKRIWSFAYSLDGFPANFINQTTGKLEGQSVDIVLKVCELAKKNCVVDSVPRADCWNSTSLRSKVLDNRTFDVCANLVESPDRNMFYQFANQSIFRLLNPVVVKNPANTSITLDKLEECNDLVMAFPALTALTRECLLAAGFFVKEGNILPITATGSIVVAINQIVEAVLAGTADFGLVIPALLFRNDVEIFGEVPCLNTLIGLNMMVNQNDPIATEFLEWWDPALKAFICTKEKKDNKNKVKLNEYEQFCQDLDDRYGVPALCFTPGVDAECPGKPIPPPPTGGGPIDPCATP